VQRDAPALAKAIERAEQELQRAVETIRVRLKLSGSVDELVENIKGALETALSSGLTVQQALWDHYRQKDFNETFDEAPLWFEDAVQDFSIVLEGPLPTRLTRKIARNAWKEDRSADRRLREIENPTPDDIRSINRGRPELYDRDVVWAFADRIAQVAGRSKFSAGHHPEVTITDTDPGSPMLHVLVAAMRWAMTLMWAGGASSTAPPTVKPEGILNVLRRGRWRLDRNQASRRPGRRPRGRRAETRRQEAGI
jgi:hypothetical protein